MALSALFVVSGVSATPAQAATGRSEYVEGSDPAAFLYDPLKINRIDITGVEAFAQIRRRLAAQDITLHISGIKLPVETTLRRAGELGEDARLRLYRTDTEALQALRQLTPLPADMAAAAI